MIKKYNNRPISKLKKFNTSTISKLVTAYRKSVQYVYSYPIEPVTTLSFRCGGRGWVGVIRTTATKLHLNIFLLKSSIDIKQALI